MIAVYLKELKSYLTSMMGYIFIFFILLLEGIYFTAYSIQSAYPVFEVTLSAITFIFLILVPILTMKIIAEERRQKTDQMLLTYPVSVPEIIMGKYLALGTVYLIPMAIISCYPWIMAKYGEVSMPMAYTGIFGFVLLGLAQIAIGMFVSSVTENPVIAAVLSFIVLFISYMMTGISSLIADTALTSLAGYIMIVLIVAGIVNFMVKNIWITVIVGALGVGSLVITYFLNSTFFESSIHKFLEIFNITVHFEEFTNGIFDLQGVVYYLSLIVFFVFLTIQSITKRRWN